eukprot:TRINITY_DN2827_c0_g1_i7.p1 TRINITY_DN2827_c0_g1~~TRINITY_DN2827_c0_g1_i7.p1  ORF type:complete len:339 (-),score=69.45 TRINITY_DN2827_c0_g1_i7:550-1566(-)
MTIGKCVGGDYKSSGDTIVLQANQSPQTLYKTKFIEPTKIFCEKLQEISPAWEKANEIDLNAIQVTQFEDEVSKKKRIQQEREDTIMEQQRKTQQLIAQGKENRKKCIVQVDEDKMVINNEGVVHVLLTSKEYPFSYSFPDSFRMSISKNLLAIMSTRDFIFLDGAHFCVNTSVWPPSYIETDLFLKQLRLSWDEKKVIGLEKKTTKVSSNGSAYFQFQTIFTQFSTLPPSSTSATFSVNGPQHCDPETLGFLNNRAVIYEVVNRNGGNLKIQETENSPVFIDFQTPAVSQVNVTFQPSLPGRIEQLLVYFVLKLPEQKSITLHMQTMPLLFKTNCIY